MLGMFRLFLDRSKLRNHFPEVLSALCLVLVMQQSSTAGQPLTIQRATITQVLDSPQVFIQDKRARVNDFALRGQRVRTGWARAQLKFNTGAVGRLAQNSVLTVGQCARLQKGTLLVNGAMTGCTPSVVAGVRGTTYLLEVNDARETRVRVLEGEVTLSRLPVPLAVEPIRNQQHRKTRITLKAGEKVSITPTGEFGLVEKLTQAEFTNLLNGTLFKGYGVSLPGITKVQRSFQRLFPKTPFPVPTIPKIPIPPIRLPGSLKL